MDNIKNYNPAEAETLDSREVAEMVEKQHRHLLRDINGYIEEMEKTGEPNFGLSSKLPKINPSDFFIPSTYTSEQGKELPCFLVTKKPWDCMSGSDQLKVSAAIVRAIKPQCGFVLLDKLEQMDPDTLREFGAWMEAEGLQGIATRVSTDGTCSILIEDGYAKEGDGPAPAPAAWKAGEF